MITQKTIFKVCSFVMGISGMVILVSTLYPIAAYEWYAAQKFPVLVSPLVDSDTASFKFSGRDYRKASNWFEGTKDKDFGEKTVRFYNLSVDRLRIENATVSVGGEDLSQNLIQFPGTADPGKTGNTVIFGHSILPQYYDPTNYLSIFSTLQMLKNGDDISVAFDGITYNYKVQNMFEVKPTDIQILEQATDGSYLTLVTCSPPGHPLKPRRLIVRAVLIPV